MVFIYKIGLPSTKITPANKQELIDKFQYVTNYDDIIDILDTSDKYFDSDVLSIFIEKLSKYNLDKKAYIIEN